MKTTKLFFMAALALMTAACSNDDNDLTTPQPQKAEGITITAQLAPKTNGATTRAVSDGTNKIVAEWAENEHLAVLYEVGGTKYAADATITAVDGSGNVMTTVTPGSASGELYVALPVMAAGTYWFNATIDSKSYIAKATTAAATVAGKYYQSTVKMATLGDVILADGKFAAPSSTGTKVAMIAYLGNGSNCTNGLAIELNASPAYMDWSAVCSYSSYPSITGNPGTWRLPSKADWQNMFVGCAKSGDAISPDGNGIMDPIAGIKEKIGATGITALSKYCWSSTESGSKVWVVQVSLYDKPKVMARARFFEANTSDSYYVLGCLAF